MINIQTTSHLFDQNHNHKNCQHTTTITKLKSTQIYQKL